jgi:hypothetical protein
MDYDPADIEIKVRIRKSRKPHKCCECERTIPAGAPYWRETLLWDYWRQYETCELCYAIRKDRFTCGFIYGSMWEEIRLWADDIAQVPEEGEDMDDISWVDPPTHPIEVTNG